MNLDIRYLPKSDVVFTVMFLNKELCEKTLNVILGENIELIETTVESKNDLHNAALNSIYFDVKTQAKDGRIITLDLQRKYIKDRIRNRTVYYACREIATQKVYKSEYEDLKSIIITFLLTEASLKTTSDNSKIQLHNNKTGELYSDLLTIHEVNIKHITNEDPHDMQILRAFFEIDSQYLLDEFVKHYGKTSFGKLLLINYASAVNNTSLLDTLSEEDKFMYKLSEEDRIEERQKGRQEGRQEGRFEIAINMLKKDIDYKTITELTGLSEADIKDLSVKL